MSSSSSSSKAKRSGRLQGPRPEPLSLPTSSARPSKKPRGDVGGGPSGPVIVYELTPRVVHARPHEFMAVVQRLTGKLQPSELAATSTTATALPMQSSTAETLPEEIRAAADLTLGQQRRHAPSPFDSPAAGGSLLSPSTFLFSPTTIQAGGSLLSPTSFLLSPTTMQAIQELSVSLF